MTDDAHRESLALMETLVLYRHQRIYRTLRRFGKRQSMLHPDVLQLIYHFARTSRGAILEIGPFRGGSTVAAALGLRESGVARKFVTIEQGGQLRGHKLGTRNILRTLKRNLARQGVAGMVTVLEGRSPEKPVIAAVQEALGSDEIGLLILDADVGIQRDLKLFGSKLIDRAWVVIDDYIGPTEYDKVAPIKRQVDELVAAGQLLPLGYYGHATWVGQWRRATSLPGQ
jgi:predicted O-methyltransferase YrrM